jgi:hypothetical protein
VISTVSVGVSINNNGTDPTADCTVFSSDPKEAFMFGINTNQ